MNTTPVSALHPGKSWEAVLNTPHDPLYRHTLREILQQPQCWLKTAASIHADPDLNAWLLESLRAPDARVLLSGAGSSDFAGQSLLAYLSSLLGRSVWCAPSTDLVTHPQQHTIPCPPALMISFARSGNSPESVASVRLMQELCPTTRHLILTCNQEGALAGLSSESDPANLKVFLLPPETNDQSLVMTSSFSSMLVALACLCQGEGGYAPFRKQLEEACEHTRAILSSDSHSVATRIASLTAELPFDRVQYLASGDNLGLWREGHLKMLEMTDGSIPTRADSFLGLRHGPQVFVGPSSLAVALLSKDPHPRRYEVDLLEELSSKNQGAAYVVIGAQPEDLPDLPHLICVDLKGLDEFARRLPSIVIAQLLGLFKSLNCNLSPDSPSASGTIHRVVSGVRIYPLR